MGRVKLVYKDEIPEKLLDSANIGLWKWSLATGKIVWSSSFRRIWGIESKSSTRNYRFLTRRIHPLDKARILQKIELILKSGREFYFVFRIKLPGGMTRWLSTHGVVVRGKNGGPIEADGVCIDITRSKTLEKELKRTISQQRAVFSSVKVGLTVEVKSGFVVYSNNETAKILGKKSIEEVNNHNIRDLLKPFIIKREDGEIIKPSKLPASEVFRGKKKVSRIFSFENKASGNVRWFKISATAVDSEKLPTEMVVKVFQDITKEYEQQQNTLTSLSVASHELKNALAGVKAYIQLVKKRVEKGDLETAKTYTASLDTQSTRLIKLINDLLDVSRIQSGFLNLSKKKFNYSELLLSMVSDFRKLNSDYKFVTKVEKDIQIVADQDRIIQLLLNLLSNAVKYSDKGSKVKVILLTKENYAVTVIKDKGYGIPKNDQKHVFELFKRGSSEKVLQTKGLGVGLYTAHAIVKEHGGNIRLNSTPGKGSQFFVEIPINNS